jgi:hypothetical protein
MSQVSRVAPGRDVGRPAGSIHDYAAVDAGVSAYIVDVLKKERVQAIVDMAISRFEAFDRSAPSCCVYFSPFWPAFQVRRPSAKGLYCAIPI